MIEITRQGHKTAPAWFIKELKLIDPELYPLWDRKGERWIIVKKAPPNVMRKGYVIEYCVSKGKEYTPLDRRTLVAIQKLLCEQNAFRELGEHLEKMRVSDEQLAVLSEKEWQGLKKEFMKKLWNFDHTKTFN